MKDILKNPSEAELIKVIELNSYDYFRSWFTQTEHNFEYKKNKNYFLGCSGFPIYLSNQVFDTSIEINKIDEIIGEIFSYFRERNLPFIWLLGQQSKPENIKEIIKEKHEVIEIVFPGMYYDLKNLPKNKTPIEGFEIRKVYDLKRYQDFIDVCTRDIEDEEVREKYCSLYEQLYQANVNDSTSTFTGYYNGIPVATSIIHYSHGVGGLYWVITSKEARRKGFGTAMTLEAMYEAKEYGYENIILHATEMGLPVYSKIGFIETCRVHWLRWTPEPMNS